MNGAGRVVHEERLVGRHRLLRLHPVDRLVCHIYGKMIVLHFRWINLGDAVIDQRIPLIRLAPDEAVELVETLMGGPAVEGARDAGLPSCGLMPFAERTSAVAIESEHFSQGRDAVRDLPGVAGKGRRGLHDRARVGRVMVATGLERVPRRRAKRCGVEVVVAQTRSSQVVEGRRLDRTPEGAGRPEADIVDQYDHNVGGFRGRLHLEARRCLDVTHVKLAIGWSFRLLDWQDRAIKLFLRSYRTSHHKSDDNDHGHESKAIGNGLSNF